MLDLLPTQSLLQTRSICHRFQNLTLRIIHGRLLRAASLTDRKLILECYHPSAQYTEPYLNCDYLGTPGLSSEIEGQVPIFEIAESQAAREGTLGRLYSHFRPTQEDPEPKTYRPHPAGDIPGSRTSEAASRVRERSQRRTVTQIVSLEAHELFVQLRFLVAVVQTGPRRGFFLSLENVMDKTLRIFRKWLAERGEAVKELTSGYSAATALSCEAERMLWVDQNKMVGLKVRVQERKWRREAPILLHRDEDQAISYTLELEGKSPTQNSKGIWFASQVFMLKACRVDCKHHASNACYGEAVARDRRRKRSSHDIWKFRSPERTIGREPGKYKLIKKGRIESPS